MNGGDTVVSPATGVWYPGAAKQEALHLPDALEVLRSWLGRDFELFEVLGGMREPVIG